MLFRSHRGSPPLHPRSMLSFAEAVKDRLHHFVERQAALGGELGRIPHLGVHDVVAREVLDALGRHTLDRVVYTGYRSTSPVAFYDKRDQLVGPLFNLSVKGTF